MSRCHPSNNKYFDCPPRMSDGRNFTDYRPSCDVNNAYLNQKQILNPLVFDVSGGPWSPRTCKKQAD